MAITELNLGNSIYTTDGFGSRPYGGEIANRYTVMANGDIVVAYVTTYLGGTAGYNIITIKIITKTGTLKATSTYTIDASANPASPHTSVIVGLYPDYEANVCLIGVSDGAYVQKASFTVLEYNTSTYNITPVSMDTHEYGVYAQYQNLGVYEYDGDIYFIMTAQYNAVSWIQVYKYTEEGALAHEFHSADSFISATTVEGAGSFADPDDESIIYTMTIDYSDGGGTPKFSIIDLEGHTITALATGGSGYLCSPAPYATNFRGGGIETVANNTLYQVYFNWDYTNSEAKQYTKFIQHRMTFNGAIGSGTLVEQGDIIYGIQDTIETITDNTVTSHAYWISKSEAQVYFVFHNNLDIWASARLIIEDWEDMAETEFLVNDFAYSADSYFPSGMDSFAIYNKLPNSDVAIVADDATHLYVYTGSAVDVADVQVYLTSHTPNDTPMTTNKSYTFRVTAYNAGQLYASGLVGFQIDSGVNEVKSCNTNGYADFPKIIATAGLHTLTVRAYNNNELLDTETYSYVFVIGAVSETGDDDTGLALMLGLFSQIIIPAVILLVPTFLFYSIIPSSVGVVTGLTLGALLGLVGNVIPPYVLIVIIIIDVLMLFIAKGE